MSQHIQKEINEQPAAIAQLIQKQQAKAQTIASELKDRFDHLLLVARGSSDNAGRYAKYLFQTACGIPTAVAIPSVYTLYQRPPQLKNTLVLGISQSGASPDLLTVFTEARRQGCPTLLITNTPNCPMSSQADYVFELGCGKEEATAATKSYTSSLAAIALLANAFQPAEDIAHYSELEALPGQLQQILDRYMQPDQSPIQVQSQAFKHLNASPHLTLFGRGYNLSTAFEIELKLKELSGLTTVAYSAADFLHGPVASVKQGHPILAVAHSGPALADVQEKMEIAKRRGAWLAVISDRSELLDLADMPLPVPAGIPEWLSPISNVLPGQFLGWALGAARGLDVDTPDGIAKVTKTW
jgi:glucosamine--fructose-6-phosphate aminotransferase (isomerizing)